MKLVIISGRSGSGKSSALHLLEDEGYYCIDNLPADMIPSLVSHLQQNRSLEHDKVALCIDVRNASRNLHDFGTTFANIGQDIAVDVVYLDADDDKLIKRFSETRRRHPLSNAQTALTEAIKNEKKLLEAIRNQASLVVDTSDMTLHELRATIKERLVEKRGPGISILFLSFAFKHGLPVDADIVFDMRTLPNPHWDLSLRTLTGRDAAVAEFLEGQPLVEEMYSDIQTYLQKWLPHFEDNNRSYMTIAIGCTGGQHRSVYMAERLTRFFAGSFPNVQVRHRELQHISD